MSREIYGSPRPTTSSTSSTPVPVINFINQANTILSDLSTAGAAGKKTALERLAVLEQLVRITVAASKNRK